MELRVLKQGVVLFSYRFGQNFYYSLILQPFMKTYFEIIPASHYGEDCSLICEVSYEGISFAIKHEGDQKYIGLAVYHFDKSRPLVGYPIALEILFNSKSYLSKNYKKVSVVYSVPESVLIPFALYNSSTVGNAINLLYGDADSSGKIETDVISESQYYNCYRVGNGMAEVFEKYFPNASHWHQYSNLLGDAVNSKGKMQVIFYSYKLVVALYQNGKCLLVNTFPYQSVQDVSYYLLSVRNVFSLEDIDLEVSGYIEQESSLFQELYKYFTSISFKALPPFCEFTDEILQYPSHYFSHLFALDVCG